MYGRTPVAEEVPPLPRTCSRSQRAPKIAGKGKKYATATVSILNNLGNPVSGATVSGTFSGTIAESVSGVTGADGSVTLQTSQSASGSLTVDFCVTNVAASGLTYNESQNTITCTSSGLRTGRIENQQPESDEFLIYPNPVLNKSLTVNLRPVGVENREFQIVITDLSGQRVYEEKIAPGLTFVQLPLQMESGMYLVEITGSRYNVSKRIIIN